MRHGPHFRHFNALVAGMVFCSPSFFRGQQPGLPASAPTSDQSSVSSLPSAQPASTRVATKLVVGWNGVDLQIDAQNASLNAVLRAVALKTNLKIQGSAPDERIFGRYGPGPINRVVPALLNGVAVNVLLTERQGGAADELTLTSRSGGPTPAYVPTQQDADVGSVPAQANQGSVRPMQRGRLGAMNNLGGNRPLAGNDPVVPDNGLSGRDNGVSGGNSNGVSGTDNGENNSDNGLNGTDNGLNNSNSAVNPTDTSTENGTSPAVRTPQEIFEQLQRLRQQQGQTNPQ